jgi:hypothetical protein
VGYLDLPVCTTPLLWRFADVDRIWNGLSFLGIAFLYFPKSQTRVQGEAAKAILKEIDYVGGFFSIVGLTLLYAVHSNIARPVH